MKTLTQLQALYGNYTQNSTAANLAQGKININDSISTICNLQGGKLRFLESTTTMFTEINTETYQIPNKYRKLIDMYIYSGSDATSDTIYAPEMVFDPVRWKTILQYRLGYGSVPYFTYVENTTFKIQPIPDNEDQMIVLRGRLQLKELIFQDVTDITVDTALTNTTNVIVNGGLTPDMIGRYIQITESTDYPGGDGMWYEIALVHSPTSMELTKEYEGLGFSGATVPCTIGQVPIVPSAYQPAIAYRAAALYWTAQGELARAKTYWMMYDGGMEAGYRDSYGGLIQQMLDNEGETEEGAYIPPFGQSSTIMTAPYYFPFQLASGF